MEKEGTSRWNTYLVLLTVTLSSFSFSQNFSVNELKISNISLTRESLQVYESNDSIGVTDTFPHLEKHGNESLDMITIMDDRAAHIFESLNHTSKDSALQFLRIVIPSRNFPGRRALVSVLANKFKQIKDQENGESEMWKWWNRDSVGYKKWLKRIFEKESLYEIIEQERKRIPMDYKYYMQDSSLYYTIRFQKDDLSDPDFNDIVKLYATYQSPDLRGYLKSLKRIPALPDSTRAVVETLIGKIYDISFEWPKYMFSADDSIKMEFKCSVKNVSDSVLTLSKDSIINGFTFKYVLEDHMDPDPRGWSDTIDLSSCTLDFVDHKDNLPFSLKTGESCFFKVIVDLEGHFHGKKEKKWYEFNMEAYLLMKDISMIKAFRGAMGSLIIY